MDFSTTYFRDLSTEKHRCGGIWVYHGISTNRYGCVQPGMKPPSAPWNHRQTMIFMFLDTSKTGFPYIKTILKHQAMNLPRLMVKL